MIHIAYEILSKSEPTGVYDVYGYDSVSGDPPSIVDALENIKLNDASLKKLRVGNVITAREDRGKLVSFSMVISKKPFRVARVTDLSVFVEGRSLDASVLKLLQVGSFAPHHTSISVVKLKHVQEFANDWHKFWNGDLKGPTTLLTIAAQAGYPAKMLAEVCRAMVINLCKDEVFVNAMDHLGDQSHPIALWIGADEYGKRQMYSAWKNIHEISRGLLSREAVSNKIQEALSEIRYQVRREELDDDDKFISAANYVIRQHISIVDMLFWLVSQRYGD